MVKVVNLRNDKYDVYIGRGGPFGNPFVIGKDGDRAEVIRKFRLYFAERLKEKEFRNAILALQNKVLGCYCAPLACHGDVIAEFIDKYISNKHFTGEHNV